MRSLYTLNQYRVTDRKTLQHFGGWPGDSTCGAFRIKSKVSGQSLNIIAANDLGWDHVSVSLSNRCPNWQEMSEVKDLFFFPHETVMQLHVPPEDHINDHPFCLHLWRPHLEKIPMPPKFMVGGMSEKQAQKEYDKLNLELEGK